MVNAKTGQAGLDTASEVVDQLLDGAGAGEHAAGAERPVKTVSTYRFYPAMTPGAVLAIEVDQAESTEVADPHQLQAILPEGVEIESEQIADRMDAVGGGSDCAAAEHPQLNVAAVLLAGLPA
jgi:hypothetical protein